MQHGHYIHVNDPTYDLTSIPADKIVRVSISHFLSERIKTRVSNELTKAAEETSLCCSLACYRKLLPLSSRRFRSLRRREDTKTM